MKRPKHLQRMFNAVPARYDGINRMMTLGLDQLWRRQAVRKLLENNPSSVLDIGAGTGDLSLLLAQSDPDVQITAADFSRPMLEALAQRAATTSLQRRIQIKEADASELPFEDRCFDAVGTAFAFRNLLWKNPNQRKHLKEIQRVTRKGGRFVAVETSQPRIKLWRGGFHIWMRTVAGPLGGLVSGQRAAYRYLATSAVNFYQTEEIREMLLEAGFSRVDQRPLLGGVACVHTAVR